MTINKGKLAIFSLILNGIFLLLFLFFVGKRFYFAHSGGPTPNPQNYFDVWNQSRNSVLSLLPIDSTDVVFVGNSLTEGFPVEEMFHSTHVKNRGIGGNQSYHVLGRITTIARGHPRKLFLDIGTNDIRAKVPLDTLWSHYKAIISIIRQESPRTAVYVQSVFPVGRLYKEFAPTIDSFNIQLRAYCQQERLPYIDVFSLMLDRGLLDSTLTLDGLHLNGKGYEIWRTAIDSLMNDSPKRE